mgnify:CR=1 FL=1
MINIDQVIDAYVKLRDKKAAIDAEAKEKTKDIRANLEQLEAFIMKQADAQGVTSFKTKHGTAFVTSVDTATVADWDAVLDFIRENEAYDMLERRVNKTAVRGYIDANSKVPSGVNFGSRLSINVRRPAKKA